MVHLAAHLRLQRRLNVGEEKKIRVLVLLRDAWLKGLENIQVGKTGFRLVQVLQIRTAPAERLALGAFQAACIDVVVAEDFLLLGAKIPTNNGDHAHLCEIAGRQRKVGGSAAKNILDGARGRSDIVECNRTNDKYAHLVPGG